MSQSREFANQSNISQQLENEIGNQRGATTTDTFNDAQSFEQQFLIGTAVHQKAKFVEKVSQIFKKSKKLKDLTGLSDEDMDNIAKGDFEKLSSKVASKLSSKLSEAKNAVNDMREAKLSKLADLQARKSLLETKEDVSNKLNEAKRVADQNKADAQDRLEQAQQEEADLADDASNNIDSLSETATSARAAADAGVDSSEADNAAKEASRLARVAKGEESSAKNLDAIADKTMRSTLQDGDAGRVVPNEAFVDANNASVAQRQVAEKARSDANEAQQKAEQLRNDNVAEQQRLNDVADGAESDLAEAQRGAETIADQRVAAAAKTRAAEGDVAEANTASDDISESATRAAQEASDARAGVAAGTSEVEEAGDEAVGVSAKLVKLTKELKVVKDADEAETATSEVDPLGIVLAGLGAIAASVIGRRIKTHSQSVSAPSIVSSSWASTVGA